MKNINETEFKKLIKENPQATVINVLSSESYEKEHIPNSINICIEDEDFIDQVQEKITQKTAPVIVYCANYACSASTEAASLLEQNGYTNVFDFKGGMEEWQSSGNQVTTGASR